MSLTKTKLCNLALSKLGSERILLSDFDTDTGVLKDTLDLHYTPTLEELTRMHSWNCCKKRSQIGAFKINIAVGSTITSQSGFSGELSFTSTDSNGRPVYTVGTSGSNGYVNLVYDDTNSRWSLELDYNSTDKTAITLSSTLHSPNGDYNGGSSSATGVTITVVEPEFEYDYSYAIPSNAIRSFYLTNSAETYKFMKPRVDWVIEGNSILTNESKIYLCYDGVPEPTAMDSLFAQAFVTLLASRIATTVTGDRGLSLNLLEEFNRVIMPEARRVNGAERLDPPTVDSEWLESTYTSTSSYSNSYPPFSQTSYGSFS